MAWLIYESIPCGVPVDQLQMTYNGNQKTKTIDYANTQTINEGDWSDIYYTDNDFKDIDDPAHPTEYLYDANGNQTADLNKSIADIKYNLLNLPSKIQFMNGNQTQYIYDAAGTKTAAIYHTAPFPVQLPLGEVSEFDPQQFYSGDIMTSHTFYCGNFVYEGGQLSRVLTPEGYVQVTTNRNMQLVNGQHTLVTTFTPQHNYFLRDHLGNTRVQLTPTASSMAVADTKSYYPFGLQHSPDPCGEFFGYSPTSTNPYLYNGKELDKMHGFDSYDYGARWKGYEDWMGVDPLAEKMPWNSPYVYCSGNPVNKIDPDGRLEWPVNKTYHGNRRRHEEDDLVKNRHVIAEASGGTPATQTKKKTTEAQSTARMPRMGGGSNVQLPQGNTVLRQKIYEFSHPKVGFKYFHDTKIAKDNSDFSVVVDFRTREPISAGNSLFSLSVNGGISVSVTPFVSLGYDGLNYSVSAKMPSWNNSNYGASVSLNADMTNKFVVAAAAAYILRKNVGIQQTVPKVPLQTMR